MPVKLGFLLLTAAPVDRHLIRLLDRLSQFPDSKIVIHHDEFQAGTFPAELVSKYNISLVKPSYRTYWSHINNVIATIEGFKELYFGSQSDWYITLTPSCYPIKSVEEILNFYENCQYDALIEMDEINIHSSTSHLHQYLIRDFKSQPWFKIPFISSKGAFYWRTIRRNINASSNPFFESYRPYHGSNWFSINAKVVERIINDDVMHGDLVQFYQKHIISDPDMHPCPQETVLQTFIGNIPHIRICYNHYRYIYWQGTTNWSPNILDISHWNEIQSSTAHWARKFQTGKSDDLLQIIDRELLGRSNN